MTIMWRHLLTSFVTKLYSRFCQKSIEYSTVENITFYHDHFIMTMYMYMYMYVYMYVRMRMKFRAIFDACASGIENCNTALCKQILKEAGAEYKNWMNKYICLRRERG